MLSSASFRKSDILSAWRLKKSEIVLSNSGVDGRWSDVSKNLKKGLRSIKRISLRDAFSDSRETSIHMKPSVAIA